MIATTSPRRITRPSDPPRHAALFMAIVALAATTALAGACNTLGTVSHNSLLAALERPTKPVDGPIVATTKDGGSARIDPRSRIRFELNDGTVTPWISARKLRTSATGISVGKKLIAYWSEVRLAEVENLSGPKVLAGVVAVAAVIVIVAIMLKGKGKLGGLGGSSGHSGKSGKVRHRGHVGHSGRSDRVGRSARVGRHHRGSRIGRRHRRSHIVVVGPRIPVVVGIHGESPPPPRLPPPGTSPRPIRDDETPTLADNPVAPSHPLFSARARRNASYRFFAAGAFGADLRKPMGLSDSLTVGIRLAELFELGVGFRHMVIAHNTSSGDVTRDSSYAAFLRVGLHIDLMDSRFLAVPVSVDIGLGDPFRSQWRLNWGFSARLTPWMSLGIYPFSPTYTVYKEDTRLANAPRWSFPTSVELAFTF